MLSEYAFIGKGQNDVTNFACTQERRATNDKNRRQIKWYVHNASLCLPSIVYQDFLRFESMYSYLHTNTLSDLCRHVIHRYT